jgi:hypothetical protein
VGKVIPFGPQSQPITETDIFNIVSLLEKAANTTARADAIANSVADRLKAGADQEADMRYETRLETAKVAGLVEERLIVDGVCRWRRIAGSPEAIRRNPNILATEPS